MNFLINGEENKLHFGKVGFIRTLDSEYKAEYNGIKFGMGLNLANTYLKQYSIPALVEVIRAAASGKPTRSEVDKALEDYAEKLALEDPEFDGLDDLFEDVMEEMGKQPLTRATMKKFNKVTEDNPTETEEEVAEAMGKTTE